MYKEHKIIMYVVAFFTFIITWFLDIEFNIIASDCISIVSYALAVYSICIGGLIGSKLLSQLDSTIDIKFNDKSQLFVVKEYIKKAITLSIVTIILSCINMLKINYYKIIIFENEFILKILNIINVEQVISSISLSLFSLNFVYMFILFNFIFNRLLVVSNTNLRLKHR